jgi:hypothetical protein
LQGGGLAVEDERVADEAVRVAFKRRIVRAEANEAAGGRD